MNRLADLLFLVVVVFLGGGLYMCKFAFSLLSRTFTFFFFFSFCSPHRLHVVRRVRCIS